VREFESWRLTCDVPGCGKSHYLRNSHDLADQARALGWGQSREDEFGSTPPRDMCPEHNPFHDELAAARGAFEEFVDGVRQDSGQ